MSRSVYDLFMWGLERGGLNQARRELLLKACGDVLEIGSGTGVNLCYYQKNNVSSLTMTDSCLRKPLIRKVLSKQKDFDSKIILQEADVEALPYEDEQFDTVVLTLVFCSVKDVDKAFSEVKRVLKKQGQVLFLEHVLPQKKSWHRLFNWASPAWTKMSGGCHLNRNFLHSLVKGGFSLEESHYLIQTIFIYGRAKP